MTSPSTPSQLRDQLQTTLSGSYALERELSGGAVDSFTKFGRLLFPAVSVFTYAALAAVENLKLRHK
jgi:hypothetical protein